MTVFKTLPPGNSLVVQWLGLRASTAGGTGLIPGQGTNIPQAKRKIKYKKDTCPIKLMARKKKKRAAY